jgi:hypothetical protein
VRVFCSRYVAFTILNSQNMGREGYVRRIVARLPLEWLACCILSVLPVTVAESYLPTVPAGATLPLPSSCYTAITSPVSNAAVLNAIHIKTAADVQSIRSRLISQIWGPGGLPMRVLSAGAIMQTTSTTPAAIASGLYPLLSTGLSSHLNSEQRWTINLLSSPSVNSIVYEWTPKVSNRRLFVMHDGHSDDSYNSDGSVSIRGIYNTPNYVTVNRLLGLGFTVLWIQMPLYGDNLTSSSSVSFPTSSICPNTSTNSIINLSLCNRHQEIFNSYGNPFRFFIEPIVVAINTALANGTFKDITMMGASGGGWSTVLAAAVDPRIGNSVSVSGSLPLFLPSATDTCAFSRDAEQVDESGVLYEEISYLDLYILAANGTQPSGGKRRHLQINDQFDKCCFFGINFLDYTGVLTNYVIQHNLGDYKYYLDSGFVGHGYHMNASETVNDTLNIALHFPGSRNR